jgi:hypothetical protein
VPHVSYLLVQAQRSATGGGRNMSGTGITATGSASKGGVSSFTLSGHSRAPHSSLLHHTLSRTHSLSHTAPHPHTHTATLHTITRASESARPCHPTPAPTIVGFGGIRSAPSPSPRFRWGGIGTVLAGRGGPSVLPGATAGVQARGASLSTWSGASSVRASSATLWRLASQVPRLMRMLL